MGPKFLLERAATTCSHNMLVFVGAYTVHMCTITIIVRIHMHICELYVCQILFNYVKNSQEDDVRTLFSTAGNLMQNLGDLGQVAAKQTELAELKLQTEEAQKSCSELVGAQAEQIAESS